MITNEILKTFESKLKRTGNLNAMEISQLILFARDTLEQTSFPTFFSINTSPIENMNPKNFIIIENIDNINVLTKKGENPFRFILFNISFGSYSAVKGSSSKEELQEFIKDLS